MAVNPNYQLTYQDLINITINGIISRINNLNGLTWIDPQFRPGSSYAVKIGEGNWNGYYRRILHIYSTSEDTYSVSENLIRNEFNSFMNSRGVLAKANQLVSTAGLLNFYNNVIAFTCRKLICQTGPYINHSNMDKFNATGTMILENRKYVVYNTSAVNYPSVPTINETEMIRASDILQMLNNGIYNLGIKDSTKCRTLNIVFSSSCSCSSSCSSSSSSSSSCAFICHIKI